MLLGHIYIWMTYMEIQLGDKAQSPATTQDICQVSKIHA
jgi:hypothetical protein